VAPLVTAVGYFLALAALFWPLERCFPARSPARLRRPELGLDATYFFAQALVFGRATARFFTVLYLAALDVNTTWSAAVRAWPLWLQALCVTVLGDLVVYWWHRACHRFEPLWRFHSVHHTPVALDWVAAHREHPLDGLMTELCISLPAVVLGIDLRAIGALVVFRGLWATFIHSNVRLPLGPLKVLFGAPELHHWHHARVARTRHNFGNLAPYLDVLFGTYLCPPPGERFELGVTHEAPRSFVGQLLRPFQRPR
jgi:sterol desaturase/sphingolipid hydroxylase (fatty acid hydroxylase superfamily)